jgi:hypothetical protein
MKYVMLRCRIGSITKMVPIIFPNELVHQDVAEAITHLIGMKHGWDAEVVGAGEVGGLDVSACSGGSETLSVSSRKEDASVINGYDYWHGIET